MKKTVYQITVGVDENGVEVEEVKKKVPAKKYEGISHKYKVLDKREFTRNFMNSVESFKCK